MEESLDAVANGRLTHTDLMRSVWTTLSAELAKFDTGSPVKQPDDKPAEPTSTCPKCSRVMKRVKGKFGDFWSCTGYGENKVCVYTETIKQARKA
jgi:DNA topoisomerase-1